MTVWLLSPTGVRWEVTRRWTAPGRYPIVVIRSEAGAVRHLPATEIEHWSPVS
jgi:hypothetical protein